MAKRRVARAAAVPFLVTVGLLPACGGSHKNPPGPEEVHANPPAPDPTAAPTPSATPTDAPTPPDPPPPG